MSVVHLHDVRQVGIPCVPEGADVFVVVVFLVGKGKGYLNVPLKAGHHRPTSETIMAQH